MPDASPPVPLRILVADDNPVVRAGLTALLSGSPGITVVAQASDGGEACRAADEHHPDVILLDVRMPGTDGIAALPYLARIAPVLMLTYSSESQIVREALRRGADGYLVHGEFTADELVAAVRDVREGRARFTRSAAGALAGAAISSQDLSQVQPDMAQSTSVRVGGRPAGGGRRSQLSTREAEIMDLIASGMTNQQIAAACFISEKTVKNHINRIFAKLHSTSRSEAAAKWLGTAPGSGRGQST